MIQSRAVPQIPLAAREDRRMSGEEELRNLSACEGRE